MNSYQVSGQLIDIRGREIYPAIVSIANGIIQEIERTEATKVDAQYLLPGFVDAHVHIESSLLIPSEFARMAVVHGTVATISDPHEIGNVLGVKGVEFMIQNGNQVPFHFFFGAPSCVPATSFETAGAEITVEDVDYLLQKPEILYLAEMMNWPGVLFGDAEVKAKIALAQKYKKPVDGHAPGLKGEQAFRYIQAGMTTDHECFTSEEALDKLKHGMKILIREGSAAKNFEALIGLLPQHYKAMMFCSDDKHPDSLEIGHLDQLVKRALAKGQNLYDVLNVACLNPVDHYKLPIGTLQVGDSADFICIDSPANFRVKATYIQGEKVANEGKTLIESVPCESPNQFDCNLKEAKDFIIESPAKKVPVIEVLDGELITNRLEYELSSSDGALQTDVSLDILKIAVINRYSDQKVATAFIKNFGIKEGAIASSVAHDSHNIIVLGTSDDYMAAATNAIIEAKGGLCATDANGTELLALPVAGLMSAEDGYSISSAYTSLDQRAKAMGSTLLSPFMSLSFMALLVIPALKLSDKGLFDGKEFAFVEW